MLLADTHVYLNTHTHTDRCTHAHNQMPRLTFQVELFSRFLLKERKTSKAEECGAEVGQVQASAALWVNTC